MRYFDESDELQPEDKAELTKENTILMGFFLGVKETISSGDNSEHKQPAKTLEEINKLIDGTAKRLNW